MTIKKMCQNKSLRWTNHILVRLLHRGISIEDVEYTLLSGEIIEQYPEDYPYPSCLVLGVTKANKHLHVVCGVSDIELWLITAYYPDGEEWKPDFKTRKEVLR
jgi:hypothetical protein